MLSLIVHNPERWAKNAPICLHCGEHDVRTGMCNLGIHHAEHVNSGYCPQGDFGPGGDERPEVWPVQEHARIMICCACPAFSKNFCGDDGASVRDHARQAICPQGRYADGETGRIETPPQAATKTDAVETRKCCG